MHIFLKRFIQKYIKAYQDGCRSFSHTILIMLFMFVRCVFYIQTDVHTHIDKLSKEILKRNRLSSSASWNINIPNDLLNPLLQKYAFLSGIINFKPKAFWVDIALHSSMIINRSFYLSFESEQSTLKYYVYNDKNRKYCNHCFWIPYFVKFPKNCNWVNYYFNKIPQHEIEK